MNLNSKRSQKALDYYLKTKALRLDFLKKSRSLDLASIGFTPENLHQIEKEMEREASERYEETVHNGPAKPRILIDDKINEMTSNIMTMGFRGRNLSAEDRKEITSTIRSYLVYSYSHHSYDYLSRDYAKMSHSNKLTDAEKASKTEELLDSFAKMDSYRDSFPQIVEMIYDYSPRNLVKKSCDSIARTVYEVDQDPAIKETFQDGIFISNLLHLRNDLKKQYPIRFNSANREFEDPEERQQRYIRTGKKIAIKLLPVALAAVIAVSAINVYKDVSNGRAIGRADYATAQQYNPSASFYDISPETKANLEQVSSLINTYQIQIPSVEEFSALLERMDTVTQTMVQEKVAAAYERLPKKESDSKVRLLRVETSTHSKKETDDGHPYIDDAPYIAIVTTDEHGWEYDFAQRRHEVTPQVKNEDLSGTRLARSSTKEDKMKPGDNLFQSMQYYSDVNEEFRSLVASGADEYQLADFINSHMDKIKTAWDNTMKYSTIKLDLDKNLNLLGLGDDYSLESHNPVPDQSKEDKDDGVR